MTPHPLAPYCCSACCERFTMAMDATDGAPVSGTCGATGLRLRIYRVDFLRVVIEFEPILESMPAASSAVN